MKTMFLFAVISCVGPSSELRPTPEQMPIGREVCNAMCSSYGRNFGDYRYDGKCVCK